jgi:hypothetical protein
MSTLVISSKQFRKRSKRNAPRGRGPLTDLGRCTNIKIWQMPKLDGRVIATPDQAEGYIRALAEAFTPAREAEHTPVLAAAFIQGLVAAYIPDPTEDCIQDQAGASIPDQEVDYTRGQGEVFTPDPGADSIQGRAEAYTLDLLQNLTVTTAHRGKFFLSNYSNMV